MQWLLDPFRQYATFAGRASRKQYWMFVAWLYPVYLFLFLLTFISNSPIFLVLAIIFLLGSFLPSLAIAVRRLHDTDRGGAWILFSLIPFGNIVLLIFLCLEGTPGPNQYGNINSQTKTKNRTPVTLLSRKGLDILRLLAVLTVIVHILRNFVAFGLPGRWSGEFQMYFGSSYSWESFVGYQWMGFDSAPISCTLSVVFFSSLFIGTVLIFTPKAEERTVALKAFAIVNFSTLLLAERLFYFDTFNSFESYWFNPFDHEGITGRMLWPIMLYLTIASIIVVFFSRKTQTISEDDDGINESVTPPGILDSMAAKQRQATTKVAERPVIPMKTNSETLGNAETQHDISETPDTTAQDSLIDALEKLAQLHSSGVLTDDEFEAMKARIINRQ